MNNEREGTVVCLLCRGMISFKSGDKTRFESHLQHEHEAYFGLDIMLAISFIREDERRAVVKSVSSGFKDRTSRIDLRCAIEQYFNSSSIEDKSSNQNYSELFSDTSVDDDNDKIYGIPEPVLQCTKCSRTFINILSLKRHEEHHIEQNYSCHECGKRFSFLEDLKQHRKLHESNVTSATDDNDDMYVAKDEFDTFHSTTDDSRSSSKEKGYVRCKLCLKIMTKESYSSHKAEHRSERKISCSICSEKFRKLEHLKKHVMKNHRRNNISTASLNSNFLEQTHKCTICNKQFQTESNLEVHMNVHFPLGFKQHLPKTTPMNSIQTCTYCSGKFLNVSDLNFHMEQMHDIGKENQYLTMK